MRENIVRRGDYSMNDLNIGKTILELRKNRNITQDQLANMVGVSAGAVSKWETGVSQTKGY